MTWLYVCGSLYLAIGFGFAWLPMANPETAKDLDWKLRYSIVLVFFWLPALAILGMFASYAVLTEMQNGKHKEVVPHDTHD